MLVHRVLCLGALAALLASYSSIYNDDSRGGAIPAYVFNTNIVLSFTIFHFFRSISTSSGGNSFVLMYGLCSQVRLVIV